MSPTVALYFTDGYETVDPVFECVCPKCHRFVPRSSVKGTCRTTGSGFMAAPTPKATGDCKRCGTVNLDLIGWHGDFT